jgi:hypothetical protein
MENIKTFENIGDFALFIKKSVDLEPNALNYFNQVRASHENSLGGCGCNRKNRLEQAIQVYKKIVVESTEAHIQELKKYLQVEKITFKHENQEFAKF